MNILDFIPLTLISVVWGCSNPLLRRYSLSVKIPELASTFQKIFLHVTNFKFVFSFLLNQSGSLLFYLQLRNSELSIAVPYVNSLTLVLTASFGQIINDEPMSKRAYIGLAFVAAGLAMCCSSKLTM